MNHASQKMRFLATSLVAHESKAGRYSQIGSKPMLAVIAKLRTPVEDLMGSSGFRALSSRAMALAGRDIPWWSGIRVGDDGQLDGLIEAERRVGPQKIADGGIIVLACMLGLLVAFIGESLTLRLVREVWPRFPLNDYFTQGDIP